MKLASDCPERKTVPGSNENGTQEYGDLVTLFTIHLTFCDRYRFTWGFPGGSDGKESACNAGDLGLVPGSGRSLGEGSGYPLQYSFLENSIGRGYKFTYNYKN